MGSNSPLERYRRPRPRYVNFRSGEIEIDSNRSRDEINDPTLDELDQTILSGATSNEKRKLRALAPPNNLPAIQNEESRKKAANAWNFELSRAQPLSEITMAVSR